MLDSLYKKATNLAAPAVYLYLRYRLIKGKEDKTRFAERLGQASLPRPDGNLVWIHAASVGESLSVISLIDALREAYPALFVLITSGTVTSAKLLSKRLPSDVIHQYVPVDRLLYVRKFLDHWQPNFALWVESELWPNTLSELRARQITTVLLNGRISEKTFQRWKLLPGWIKEMLGTFSMCLAQTVEEGNRFKALGGKDVRYIGNLKYSAAPLPYDEEKLAHMRAQVGNRPMWLIASTHPGEDKIAVDVHKKLAASWPDLLTIIVPRHTARGHTIAKMVEESGLSYSLRSKEQPIINSTAVYIADTMGEMGLFYRLASIACIGGSFVWGGHNPIEAAQLDCAIVFGPKMTNFMAIASEMVANKAAIQVANGNELANAVEKLFKAPEDTKKLAQTALALAKKKNGVLADTMKALRFWLEPIVGDSL